jgi:hypothetical protein
MRQKIACESTVSVYIHPHSLSALKIRITFNLALDLGKIDLECFL